MGLSIRHTTEELEFDTLSVFAMQSRNNKGRLLLEEECNIRTVYQRDRDRIIHCKSFRSLKEKTQVFIAKHDSFRTRLTHTLEVNQISRTIAKALRLNEDLVEAIALGHDLGHTCFGHKGEEILDKLYGGFRHNEQSLRLVDILERDGRGLNLTFEVRDGILNHTGVNDPLTLEGKLVKKVDRIAYLCHDVQDSINAGIIKIEDLPRVVINRLGKSNSERINTFVVDIINETYKNLNDNMPLNIYVSNEVVEAMDLLREFMFENVYYGSYCSQEDKKAGFIVESLYKYFLRYPKEMPLKYYNNINKEGLERSITDLIASLTDTCAVRIFNEKFIPSTK